MATGSQDQDLDPSGERLVRKKELDEVVADLGTGGGGLTTIVADDEDITVPAAAGTTVVLYTALTAPREVTLPPASGSPQVVIVKDVNNDATDTNTVTLLGSGGDTVAGAAELRDAGDVSTGGVVAYVNDGDETWAPTNDTSPGLTACMRQLGGTDGDGNVYSIEYDPDDFGLEIKCVSVDGTVSRAFVMPAVAGVQTAFPDGSSSGVQCSGNVFAQAIDAANNSAFFVADPAPGGGAYLQVSNDGESVNRIFAVNQDDGLSIDGTPFDPRGQSVVRAFPFAFDTPDLLTGAPLYTPTEGDILLDAWVQIDEAWDGTDPTIDVGTFDGVPTGLFAGPWGRPIDASQADDFVTDAHLLGGGNTGPLSALNAIAAAAQYLVTENAPNPVGLDIASGTGSLSAAQRSVPAKFTTADPIKVCVTQDGTNTGSDPGATQGAATLYLVTATPRTAS